MHTIWKGSISFGLVNIPVRLYSASQERELKFVMLHKKDMSQIRFARICKSEEKEVPWAEIVKGYEYQPGDFVVLEDEDFQKANLQKTKTIEIINFVEESEIESIYYEKPYYLEPDKEAGTAYNLLREAMLKTGKVGLAKYVIHNKEHLAVVKPHQNVLIVNQLRFYNELVQPDDIKVPSTTKVGTKELDIAMKLIDQLTEEFKPEDYTDTYTEEIKDIIEKKAKGKPIHPKKGEVKTTKVHDIMELLQASLNDKKKKPAKATTAKAPAKAAAKKPRKSA